MNMPEEPNLSNAILTGADLTGANLTRADLSGACWVDGRTCADRGLDPPSGECK